MLPFRVARGGGAQLLDGEVAAGEGLERWPSDHFELGVEGAGALERLQDGQQVLRRGAEAVEALTTSARRVPAGIWINEPGSWRMAMSVFSATVVCPLESGPGWLMMGVELMVTDSEPCATAQGPA